jgi:transposase
MKAAELPVELLETRHVRDAFKAMPVKTDRKDARGIAQLMRLGWFRPVHCKSLPPQEVRALLTTRKLLQSKRHDLEMSIRGILRGFGLKVGPTTPKTFETRVRELVRGHSTLEVVAGALLKARAAVAQEFQVVEKRLMASARADSVVRTLMSVPGVDAMVALTFSAAIDDPARFRSSRMVWMVATRVDSCHLRRQKAKRVDPSLVTWVRLQKFFQSVKGWRAPRRRGSVLPSCRIRWRCSLPLKLSA